MFVVTTDLQRGVGILNELLKVRLLSFSSAAHQLILSRQYENVQVEIVSTRAALTFFKKEDIEQLDLHTWTNDDK